MLNLGLFGFGTAGEGLYRVLEQSGELPVRVKRIGIKQAGKKRNAPAHLFTTDAAAILNDPEINVIVEAITDTEAAFAIVRTALLNGKDVVSANKQMVAAHFSELRQLQQQTGCAVLYEAAVCAAIPIIRSLEEYYRFEPLRSLRAIANGSCNYILTKILLEQNSYAQALQQAREKGFAEADPAQDVEGWDAAAKLRILLAHGFGIVVPQKDLLFGGIRNIQVADADFARKQGWQIKLVAQVLRLPEAGVAAWVLPQFVTHTDPLFGVYNENNGVVVENAFTEKQFFGGRGAGSYPTASALRNDVAALLQKYRYTYRKLGEPALTNDIQFDVFCSFPRKKDLPEHFFAHIQEWRLEGERQLLTGSVQYSQLADSDWWRKPGVSLILLPAEQQAHTRERKSHSEPEVHTGSRLKAV